MAPFSEIVLRDLTPADVVDIVRKNGCVVEASPYASKNADNLTLYIQYEGTAPFSVCVLTQMRGTNDTRFIYMQSNGAATVLDWILIVLSPILPIPYLVVSFFRTETEYDPTGEQRCIAIAYDYVISMLKSNAAFGSSGLYEGTLYP